MNILKLTLLLLNFLIFVSASPRIPNSTDIISVTQINSIEPLSIKALEIEIIKSKTIGYNSYSLGFLSQQALGLYEELGTNQSKYLYAMMLQKQHNFQAAEKLLTEVVTDQPEHINARLALANITMVQGEFTKAKQHCLGLMGLASIETISTCSLDVMANKGEIAASYNALLKISQRQLQTDYTRHVLAEMAYNLGNAEQALPHISNIELSKAPVSLVVLWADIQLDLKNYHAVFSTLTQLCENSDNQEDAVLIRIVQAQKQLGLSTAIWQHALAAKIALRELRNDTFHASDLTKYYLLIQPDADKALFYAKLNWQQAKLIADKKLLAQATHFHQEHSL